MADYKVEFKNIYYRNDIIKASKVLSQVIDRVKKGHVYTGSASFSSTEFEIKLKEDVIIVKKL